MDIENILVVTKRKGDEKGKDWEFEVSGCKLLYVGWINKVLLYSTGNYIQYLVINHNGKEYEREYKYDCNTLPYSRNEHSIVNQVYFNKILKNIKCLICTRVCAGASHNASLNPPNFECWAMRDTCCPYMRKLSSM